MNHSILHLNSSGRYEGSITREVSSQIVDKILATRPDLTMVSRDLAAGLPFIDEQWINANFTEQQHRSDEQEDKLSFSNQLVAELKQAEYLVIASPVYNFSVPAVLKAWIDLIARAKLTFQYTKSGPQGLLSGKKAIIVMASGGVEIGSEIDFASRYLKQVMSFIGIEDVTVVDSKQFESENLNIESVVS